MTISRQHFLSSATLEPAQQEPEIPRQSSRKALLILLCLLFLTFPALAYPPVQEVAIGPTQAWLMPRTDTPIFSVRLRYPGLGNASDSNDLQGLAELYSALLFEGTEKNDGPALHALLNRHAIRLSFSPGPDQLDIHLQAPKTKIAIAFSLLQEMLHAPALTPEALERVRQRQLTALTEQTEDPATLASLAWWQNAFPQHPYGRNPLGTPTTLAAITPETLSAYQTRLNRTMPFIAASGDITPSELSTFVAPFLPKNPIPSESAPTPTPLPTGLTSQPLDTPQSTIIFGLPWIPRTDPEFFPAFVLQEVLAGGGFRSWLMQDLRESKGLVYGASADMSLLDQSSLLVGELSTKPGQERAAIEALKTLLVKAASGDIPDGDIEAIKTYLTGSLPLDTDTSAKLSSYVMLMRSKSLPKTYLTDRQQAISAVTPDEVRHAAKRLLDPNRLLVTIAGKP